MTQTLITADPVLHLLAAAGYLLTFVLLMMRRFFDLRVGKAAMWMGGVALLVHSAAIAARWGALGHLPVVTMYDNLSWYAFAVGAIGLYLTIRRPSLWQVGLVLYPSAFATLVWGLYTGPRIENLPPTFSGIWFVMHIAFYYISFGAAVAALGASVFLLWRPAEGTAVRDRLPDLVELDRLAYKFVGLTFAFWGFGMLTGSVWAFSAWGRYWAWDPIETWSLVTWIVMGLYLHLRRFYGWKDARAAWLYLLSFVFVLIALFASSLFMDTIHAVYFQ